MVTKQSKHSCEAITANLNGKPQRRTWNGRDWLVVPVSMMTPGVRAGSQGPLLYRDGLTSDFTVWNGMPVVLRHPVDERGSPVTARHPDVLEKQGLGWIFESNGEGKLGQTQLGGYAWLDVANVERIDKTLPSAHRILPRLLEGKPVEVSTGLFTENQPAQPGATWNGTPYEYEVVSWKPDHLAILPDQEGACSVRDGCGLNVNGKSLWKRAVNWLIRKVTGNEQPSDELDMTPEKACKILEDGAVRDGVASQELTEEQRGMFGAKCKEATKNERMCWGRPCDQGPQAKDEGAGGSPVSTGSALDKINATYESIKEKDYDQLSAEVDSATKDLTPQETVELAKGFEITERRHLSSKAAAVSAIKAKIERRKENHDRTSAIPGINSGDDMDRKKMIQHLTANCKCWQDGKGQAALSGMSDDQLKELVHNNRVVLVINEAKAKKDRFKGFRIDAQGVLVNAEGEGEAVPGVPWTKLAQLLGVEIDPRQDPVGFASELKGKLDDIAGKLGGAPPPVEEPIEEPVTMSEQTTANKGKVGAAALSVKTPTLKEWEAGMPPEARAVWNEAKANVAKERQNLIAKLVANVAEDQREAVAKVYGNMPTDQLRLLAANVKEQARDELSFDTRARSGAAGDLGPDFSLAAGGPPTLNIAGNDGGWDGNLPNASDRIEGELTKRRQRQSA